MDIRCRLCANFFPNQISVLGDMEFCARIYQLFQVKVSMEDRLPTTICSTCYSTVEKIWDYLNQVSKAQKILLDSVNAVLNVQSDPLDTSELTFETNDIKCVFAIDENALDTAIDHQHNDEPCLQKSSTECVEQKNFEDKAKCDENVEETVLQSVEDMPKKLPIAKLKLKPSSKSRRPVKKKTRLCDIEDSRDIHFTPNEDGSVTPSSAIERWNTYPWTCSDCHAVCETANQLKDHFSNVHSSVVRYMCLDCPRVYYKYVTFIGHIREHRPVLKYCCDACYKLYLTEDELEKHKVTAHKILEDSYVCNTCGKKFRLHSSMLMHLRVHLPVDLKNRYSCDQCPKKFGTKPNLVAHKRIHSGVRDYTCHQCGKSFVQKGNLDNHMLTHASARPFCCDLCGKSFKTLMRLKKHGTVHSGLKPHQCDICGRQFRERGTLKEHHRIHTGVMPFTCEFCGKSFRFKGVLTTHRRQHTGERPYSCNECQHHFTNWPNYNKHMKRRHGINTSVNTRTKQEIPPTGMPHRNPPGTILAPPQQMALVENTGYTGTAEMQPNFYHPVLGMYNIQEELMPQRV